MFGERAYQTALATITLLVTLCWLGFVGPFAAWLPRSFAVFAGPGLMILASAMLLGNLYLISRRYVMHRGESYFPLAAAVAAAGGLALLQGASFLEWLGLLVGCAVFDLIGVQLLGFPIAWLAGWIVSLARKRKRDTS